VPLEWFFLVDGFVLVLLYRWLFDDAGPGLGL
jgi:hypothetical protein